jgi:hypothetical protein
MIPGLKARTTVPPAKRLPLAGRFSASARQWRAASCGAGDKEGLFSLKF